MMDWRKAVFGAASGFVSAFLVDLQAWSKTGGTFDWGIALKRWLVGAVSGAMTGAGIGASGL